LTDKRIKGVANHVIPFAVLIHGDAVLDVTIPIIVARLSATPRKVSLRCILFEIPYISWFGFSIVQPYPSTCRCWKHIADKPEKNKTVLGKESDTFVCVYMVKILLCSIVCSAL